MKITEIELSPYGTSHIPLPENHRVLSVASNQHGSITLTIAEYWGCSTVYAYFEVVSGSCTIDDNAVYIGTVETSVGLKHIFRAD